MNTALASVLGNEAKFQEREHVYLLQILKTLCTGPLSGLSGFRKLSENMRITVSEIRPFWMEGRVRLLRIGQSTPIAMYGIYRFQSIVN